MSYKIKKAVDEIITSLKKLPEPGKKSGSFWNFMKSQLVEETQWNPEHLKIIENEINKYLSKLDKKSLNEMWKEININDNESSKISVKEMKNDIIDNLLGEVMNRMDESYSARTSLFMDMDEPLYSKKKKTEDDDEFLETEDFSDDDFGFDENLFDNYSDDDEY